jgi:phage shock protein C
VDYLSPFVCSVYIENARPLYGRTVVRVDDVVEPSVLGLTWALGTRLRDGGAMDELQPQQPQPLQPRKLYRSQTNRMVAGVCGGLAEYFNVDATLIRILFVVLTVFGGAGLVLYLAMWILVPDVSKAPPSTGG